MFVAATPTTNSAMIASSSSSTSPSARDHNMYIFKCIAHTNACKYTIFFLLYNKKIESFWVKRRRQRRRTMNKKKYLFYEILPLLWKVCTCAYVDAFSERIFFFLYNFARWHMIPDHFLCTKFDFDTSTISSIKSTSKATYILVNVSWIVQE